MIQINHLYKSVKLLKQEIEDYDINLESSKILIQIFTSILDIKYIKNMLSDVLNLLPNATIIGTSTSGEILNGSMIENKSVLSISVFETVTISSSYSIGDDSSTLGKKIATDLFKKDSRCIIAFVDGLNHNGDNFLESLNDKNQNHIPIAGGMSGDMQKFENTFTIFGDKVFENGAVAVSLNGKNLEVFQDYNLGWRAVGPKFIITKSKNNRVYEINNKPILEIYVEVLGEDVIKNLPNSTIEFPLIKNINGTLIARSMVIKMDDDSILYAGNLYEGDEVQFGIGSSMLVNQYAPSNLIKSHKHEIQASFIYSCSARKQFLGYSLEKIFREFATISPSVGFFTYGEFFYSKDESSLLNITTTALFLNEKNTKLISSKTKDAFLSPNHLSSVDKATYHLIDYMTKELEQREKEVLFNKQRVDEYIDAINSTLIISKTDKKGIITYTNDKFEKISGYTKDELLGKAHNIVRHPKNKPEIFKDMWRIIQSGKIWHGSFANMKKDGSVYYVTSSIIPIHGINKEIIEYMCIREDITELVEARLNAEEAKASQETFFANMSHEIRTPMNGILGFADLLLETKLDTQQNKYIDIIHNSASTLLNIINDILDFSKIKNQKVILESIEMDSIRELENVCELLNSLAGKKSIKYTKKFDKNMAPYIYGDPTKLKQVITNLISNAIKFTPENGKVKFKTKVIKDTLDKQTIRFSIKDSGIGIPKDKQALIFSAFTQANASTSREFGGTGLGLSISKSFVEAFGGELKLKSKEGKGSTFYFDIEFKTCKKIDTKKIEFMDKKESEIRTISNAKLKVLIAEDYEVNRILMELIFKDYDIEPSFALDGLEAVEKVKNNRYDIIFMDINMPNMNGIEATKKIRKLSKDIPIVALTANIIKDNEEKFLNIGMTESLGKPIDRIQLQKILFKYSLEK
ncbi:MAG: FIST N-terminal domain-containing protein [Campylobacterota bacterium]|nr:FIST N-terminal domain-containing protein [Campylobacterota bacterium]